jgi:hypothetical protein
MSNAIIRCSNLPDSPNRSKAEDVKRPFLYGYPEVKHSEKPKHKDVKPTVHTKNLCKKNESSEVKSLLSYD